MKLAVESCLFEDNFAQNAGGAIYGISDVIIKMKGNNFTRNRALKVGGAIYLYDNVTLKTEDTTLTHNSALLGGAINMGDSYLHMVNCIFTNNKAQELESAEGSTSS